MAGRPKRRARLAAAEHRICLTCETEYPIPHGWEACPTCFLTPKQQEVNRLLNGPQRHTLIYGGARSGKTVLIVRAIMHRAIKQKSRHVMFRRQANAARASLWLETLPKVQQIWFPQFHFKDHMQRDGYVEIVETGSEIWITGTDDKDRIEKILGKEFISIYFNECSQIPYSTVTTLLTRLAEVNPYVMQRAYYDLNPVGTRHYTSQLFVRHRDPFTLRPILDADQRAYAYMNPKDNRHYLSTEFLTSLEVMPERQRRRFYEGIYQAEVDGALWTFEGIEAARVTPDDVPKTLRRVVVAIDPSGTRGEIDERSDDVGIVVAGLGDDGLGYILADRTCQLPPEGWAKVAITAYHEFKADRVVAEGNFGGDMVRATIHSQDRNVSVELVTASRGKAVRAEPVSALYGRERDGEWVGGRIRHVGSFPELEDQMMNFSSAGYTGDRSPDRADALVWAITDLMLTEMKGYAFYEIGRRMAAGETKAQIAGIVAKDGEEPKRESLLDLYLRRRAEIEAGKT